MKITVWRRLVVRCSLLGAAVAAVACGGDDGGGGAAGSGFSVGGPAGGGGPSGAAASGAGTGVIAGAAAAGTPAAGTGVSGAGAGGAAGGSSAAGGGGASGTGAAGQNMTAGAGGNAQAGSGGQACTSAGEGATEHFSFFVTSLAGLRRLSGSENGFGGDLRFGQPDGLSGADEICRQLAESSFEGAGCKTWRAFLSVIEGPDGEPVHAKDRIGDGPWYDRLGRLVANDQTALLADWPTGADPIIMEDLPNEDGVPNHDPDGMGNVDNHNTVTGTAPGGMLFSMDPAFTCKDWTSSVGTDGTPMIGFSWRGGAGAQEGSSWYSNTRMITEGGCAPIINLEQQMDFSARGIGSRGGYGGFYCLALEP